MDDEIKNQANDELAQALASVSSGQSVDPMVAAQQTTQAGDDDFSDFSNASDNIDENAYGNMSSKDARMDSVNPVNRQARDASTMSTNTVVDNGASQTQTVVASAPIGAKLENIKDRALQELRPLMESIDIPAGEKYDTYLMMLRASDDQTLIEPTFKAARMIEDDKTRAKALLDIVHEINYLNSKAAA